MSNSHRVLPLLLLLLASTEAAAQSAWLPTAAGNSLDLRISRGFYGEGGPGLATFAMTPSIRVAVGPRVMVEAELPIAAANQSNGFGGESATGFLPGNPYGGIAAELAPSVRLRAGLRLGIISDDPSPGEALALGYGVISEYDRFESYLPDYTTVRATVELGAVPARGGFAQARVGGSMFLAGEGGENESLAEYGVRIGMHTGAVLIHGGLLGRAVMSAAEGASIADRTTHMVALGVGKTSGRVRPNLEFRYFLDEFIRDEVKGIVALGMSVAL